ncbi:MAG: DUF5979 domain-containing protein [Eubacteriales bacterium]|nr:DUF5979 domain-containing protein [Eubacteriales bacterium]
MLADLPGSALAAEALNTGEGQETESAGENDGLEEDEEDGETPENEGENGEDPQKDNEDGSASSEEGEGTLCRHHPEHTEECGYQKSVCSHEHTADCYEQGTEVLNCPHVHDGECGYEESASDGTCGFVCAVCPIEERIGALPSVDALETMDEDALWSLREEIDRLCEEIGALTEEEQAQLDREALDALLDALSEAAGEELSVTADDGDAEEVIGTGGLISKEYTPASWVDDYGVEGISPSNVTINLFDYWLHEQDTVDARKWTAADNTREKTDYKINNTKGGGETAHWWREDFLSTENINRDEDTIHPFLFAGITQTDNWRFGVDEFIYADGSSTSWGGVTDDGHASGRYNTYVNPGNGAYQGILQSTLGEDGYPALDLTDTQVGLAFKELEEENPNYEKSKIPDGLGYGEGKESLAYLFDPDETEQAGKESYKDVIGLLQKDSDGYYYYDATKNFAEFDRDSHQFYLFRQSAGVNGGKGQFFPFNSAKDVFEEDAGALKSKITDIRDPILSHYFGLTMEVDFYQPDGGMIEVEGKEKNMEFTFSGDDDVWVFIDGVLVADLGGIHDATRFTIDFSTGVVKYDIRSTGDTSLREMFLQAIEDNGDEITDSQGNTITKDNIDRYFRRTGTTDDSEQGTFRSGTEHCLQFYYLERGNQQSNMSLKYNLVPPIADDVVKLDQDNEPIADVGFTLWTANEDYEKQDELAKFATEEDGVWTMLDDLDIPFDFEEFLEEDGTKYYVLEETTGPKGYRKVPDIHLEYDDVFHILKVTNTWDTGAVGNFNAKIYQVGDLKYTSDGTVIPTDQAKPGMVIAVPLLKTGEKQNDAASWSPIYGSNKTGFTVSDADTLPSDQSGTEKDTLLMRKRILKAALHQIWLSQQDSKTYSEWHLVWTDEEGRYQGTLNDLPGTPDRYYRTADDVDADLVLSYYFIDGDVFKNPGQSDEEQQLGVLKSLVEDELLSDKDDLDAAIDRVADDLLKEIRQVDLAEFTRLYGSHIYIPNAVNTLAVQKLNENGAPMENVTFGLYDAINGENPVVEGKTDKDGRLLFSADAEIGTDNKGQVRFELEGKGSTDPNDSPKPSYWLHEMTTLDGYELNESWIPVYVTDRGVYADALARNDGIQVQSGLGKLLGTMTRYAVDGGVNVTLRDLILTGGENSVTETGGKELLVHYGLDTALIQYGTHEGVLPVFITDEGVGYGRATQNLEAHTDPDDEFYYPFAVKTNLGEKELSNLFTGSTAVVVRNVKEPASDTGRLTISKTVVHLDGSQIDPDRAFTFTIKIDGAADKTYQTDRDGVLLTFDKQNSAQITLKHNESLTILGLPANAKWTVTESGSGEYRVVPSSGQISGTIQTGTAALAAFQNRKGDEPEKPDKPDEPGKKDPGEPTKNTPESPSGGSLPQTGQPWLWALILALLGAGLTSAGLLLKPKRKRKRKKSGRGRRDA